MTSDPAVIAERRLHPAYLVISLGRSIRTLLPLIAVGIWKAPGWAVAVLAGLIALRALGEWWARTYAVQDGSLRVRSGLFNQTRHTIGINRITALDAERGVVQRIFRVWGLKVQTPGNDHRSSVHLVCLSAPALAALRTALRPPGLVTETPVPEDPAVTLAALDTRTLLIAAVTGTSVPLILAGAAATFGRARDLLPERTFHRLTREVFVGGTTTALLLLAAAALAVLAGIGLTSLRLARFSLARDGDRLRISRGLIAQRSGTIPVDRVQAVRIVQGWWRRMLGYCALEVEVAGLSTSDDTERSLFPLLRLDAALDLVSRALPELRWTPGPLTPVPGRARRRYLSLPVLCAAPIAFGLYWLPGWGTYLAVVPVPLALLVGWGQAMDAAWSFDATTVTFRWRRVLATHTVIARRSRVQLLEVTRTPFQRRVGLAGVRLLLSSKRKARLRHLEADDALVLLHQVGRGAPSRPAADVVDTSPGAPVATYRER
ncbi:putative membrane protein [Nakamurella panacisegetis]|uniref:Putative membrane protein n=1 Tax=Nakamurella panacisegetis TaxID=1090615 RepID=A0A1H0HY79_9ACTN|nr:PH domain-containing protein [Nakamurella panacisegetis]SDO24105.1 putative membrane protein [Nakamurella panacisegetis]